MMRTSISSIFLLILLVSSSFTSLFLTEAHATTNLVTVTAANNDMTTTLKFTNNSGDVSDISSIILQIGQNQNFKSFKTEPGWFGIRTALDTLTFTSINPIKSGQSANFIIKTDQANPVIIWKALDNNSNELDSGQIGASAENPPTSGETTPPAENSTETPTENNAAGILSGSSFRIVPSTPSPGMDIRVIGQGFSNTASLDLYIDDRSINSFSVNSNFVTTATVPEDQSTGSVNFILKDQNGNSKTFSTIIQPVHQRANANDQNIPLTLTDDSIYHRGESKTINGTATPGSTLTIAVLDSNGNTTTTFTTTADKTGHYSYTTIVPIDAAFGEYTIVVSDGKNKVSKAHNIVTTHQIILSTSQQEIDPGKTIVINGTSISNQPVSFRINDPTGNQIFAEDVNVTSDGTIALAYPVDSGAVKGTYIVTASQGTDQVTLYFGVGEIPVPQLTLSMDRLNYQNSDKPVINISGPPTSTLNLVIVDPSGKQKFADTVLLGSDGFVAYSFNVTSYTPGIYSAVVTRGNDKATENFAIGLQTGCGAITMKTVKDTYLLGDSIITLGKSNPNCIIKVTLSDPNGIIVKSEETFSDKTGIFSSTDFRIPSDGTVGTWQIDATSGINHTSLPLTIKSGHEGISVKLDRIPPVYVRGNDIVTISGTGAGNNANIIINVLDTNSTQITSFNISSTNVGDYSTIWKIPLSFNPGSYTIQVKSPTGQATTNITIQ